MRAVPIDQILVVAAALFAAVALGLAVRAWYGRLRLRRRWARARKIERQASLLLADLGYQVLDSQVETTYTLRVDGEPSTVKLRADYLVSRAGRRFVAEVKSGQVAPRLDTAATRRQLLEYSAMFQVDGILLVDGEARQVYEVTFPTRHHGSRRGALYGFALGLAVAMAFAFWFLSLNPATSLRSDPIGAGGRRAPEAAKHR